jgi:hypothetical protein
MQQTINTFCHETRLPAPNRRLAFARPPQNLHRADPIGTQQDNPNPPHMLLRAVPRPDNLLKPSAISRTKLFSSRQTRISASRLESFVSADPLA